VGVQLCDVTDLSIQGGGVAKINKVFDGAEGAQDADE